MDIIVPNLIITKIHAPRIRSRIIQRSHLLNKISNVSGTKLISVVAPAGYGKSTFLAEWAQSLLDCGTTVAWYFLDATDDNPTVFGTYLTASFSHALGIATEFEHISQLLRSSPEIDLQRILPAIINTIARSNRDCVLIIDDYHLVSKSSIHNAMTFLLEHLPQNMKIAIGSRSDLPFPLSRLRVREQLSEIRSPELQFSLDETNHFLNEIMKLDLSLTLVKKLETRTEGWVAGLQLAALSLFDHSEKEIIVDSINGNNRYLSKFLFEEIFTHQSEDIQSFLLSTSILERMCSSLCDTILVNSSNSSAILEYLEHSNLFTIPLDDQGCWYRYHNLFREFLLSYLKQTHSELVTPLHRSASEWLSAHNHLREAGHHAFRTHNWDYAANFVEKHCPSMLIHSETSTIYDWCSTFPEEVILRYPLLCIYQSWALVLSYRLDYRERIEDRLNQVNRFITDLEDKQLVVVLISHMEQIRSYLAMIPDPTIDLNEQLIRAQNMLGLFNRDNTGQFSTLLTIGYAQMALHKVQAAIKTMKSARKIALRERLYSGIVESTFQLSQLAHSKGQLRDAFEICMHCRTDISTMISNTEKELPMIGCLNIAMGSILLEQNQLEKAEQELLHGLELISRGFNPYYQMTVYTALFRLREIQNRPNEALGFLLFLEEIWPDIAFYTQSLRLVQTLKTSPENAITLADASTWCQTFQASFGKKFTLLGLGPMGTAEIFYLSSLSWISLQIATGNSQSVLYFLERSLDQVRIHGLIDREIELNLLEAQAWRAIGDNNRSYKVFRQAFEMAQPRGYIRIFDQGPVLTELISDAENHGVSSEYIKQILSVIRMPKESGIRYIDILDDENNKFHSSSISSEHIIRYLTKREFEVLNLISKGASNQEIAESLFITIGTVKSHVNHIFKKLNVHNRTEAVACARSLGFLEL